MVIFGGRSDLTTGAHWQVNNLGPDYYSNKVSYYDTVTSSWHSPDCASCMMIETGEKTSQPGLRCESCGRFPRSIGGY